MSEKPPKPDHVPHYVTEGYECIDVMRAISSPSEFQAYCRLNAIKYLWRLGKKDGPLQEARKALDYMAWLVHSLEENKER